MKKIFLYTLILSILISCKNKSTIEKESNHDNIAILDNDKVEELKNTTKAHLSEKEIDEVNIILNKAVDDYNSHPERHFITSDHPNKNDLTIDLKNYKRQYIPYVNKKGEKEVWIYCLCETRGSNNWKTDVYFVAGGGDCYFSVTINLSRKEFYKFYPNGPA